MVVRLPSTVVYVPLYWYGISMYLQRKRCSFMLINSACGAVRVTDVGEKRRKILELSILVTALSHLSLSRLTLLFYF